jgi:hypothetical protein
MRINRIILFIIDIDLSSLKYYPSPQAGGLACPECQSYYIGSLF